MIARHHNNKANKVASAFVDRAPCTPSSRLSSSRRPRTVSYFNRRRRGAQQKLAKFASTPLATAKVTGVIPATAESGSVKPQVRISLPTALQRPTLQEVKAQAIYDLCPELKDVAPDYVRLTLSSLAPQMLAGIHGTQMVAPTSQLPHELEVVVSDSLRLASVTPTHILALSSSRSGVSSKKYQLFPIHQLVFAANCSTMPALPSSFAATPAGNSSRTATLPVVSYSIPSPETFGLLSEYLYTKNADVLRSRILPVNWALDIETILRKAFMIRGLWANACAFGVVDPSLYDVLEDCWAAVLRSLHQATSTPSS
ncbi:hypothetical protein GALMADRAFT_100505 [Galerina marginata CBS 339.88]|uniref:Uncharacterized protein n=1 Tax=Galerina marginata (strain CBS 339.88) TaxID=685588 RepID=A0A067T156_GALM3|nr:hypothetical protein GALMADRAFT_100505 [Galerina marginata CBS 339.88]